MRKYFILSALILIITSTSYSQDYYKWELNTGANYYPKGLFLSITHLNKLPGRHSTLTLQLIGSQVGITHYLNDGLGIGFNSNFSKFRFDFGGDEGIDGIYQVSHLQRNHSLFLRKRTDRSKKVIFYGQVSLNLTSLKRSSEYTGSPINATSSDALDSYFNKSGLNFSTGVLAGIEKRLGSRIALYLQFGHDDILSMLDQDNFYFSFDSTVSGTIIPGQGFTYDSGTNDMTVNGVENKYLPYHFDLGLVFKFSKDKF